jgi:serine protease Do
VDAPCAEPPQPAVRCGDRDAAQIGQRVFVVGNALGVDTSVTSGIVSALDRNIKDTPYDGLIQIDARSTTATRAVLFDRHGEVIDIAPAILSPTAASAGLDFGPMMLVLLPSG